VLREGDRDALEGLVRSRSARAGLVRIVFLAADGLPNTEIARRVGASRTTVIAWRNRYRHLGMDDLVDAERPGRPRKVDYAAIVTATLTLPRSC
jgi:putative ATPase subunit of terminase (gpP-like)